jgi:hypothetical protein
MSGENLLPGLEFDAAGARRIHVNHVEAKVEVRAIFFRIASAGSSCRDLTGGTVAFESDLQGFDANENRGENASGTRMTAKTVSMRDLNMRSCLSCRCFKSN